MVAIRKKKISPTKRDWEPVLSKGLLPPRFWYSNMTNTEGVTYARITMETYEWCNDITVRRIVLDELIEIERLDYFNNDDVHCSVDKQ